MHVAIIENTKLTRHRQIGVAVAAWRREFRAVIAQRCDGAGLGWVDLERNLFKLTQIERDPRRASPWDCGDRP
ncbi:MAG: hypothetical protein K9G71_13345 [Rhodobacteraceae bacterium]|nr:hypothetical protein [Paracoccaceae bacterium]MCF8519478.1 hypothetical protein [Paracoccaceae bacterium]